MSLFYSLQCYVALRVRILLWGFFILKILCLQIHLKTGRHRSIIHWLSAHPVVAMFFCWPEHICSTVPFLLVWRILVQSHPPAHFCRHVLDMSQLLMAPHVSVTA